MIKTITYKLESFDVKRFAKVLRERGISQERIARETGMTQSEVSNCLLGKRTLTPSLEKWLRMHHFELEPQPMTIEEALECVDDKTALKTIKEALGLCQNT